MSCNAVIFDLDGTLLDTLQDLATSLNSVLATHNFPTHSLDAVRLLVGHGMKELVRKALPTTVATEETVEQLLLEFMQHYSANWKNTTRPYSGISTMLDAFTARGTTMAILSNKADEFTKLCVEHLLPHWSFAVVMGLHNGIARKPDPQGALLIAKLLGVEPASILYVGDSGTDMLTATRAGMYPLGVLWGFRSKNELVEAGAKTVVQHPEEVAALADSLL